MKVKLQRFTIGTTRNIKGNVIERRHGYIIALKLHWYSRTRYIRLLQDWYHDMEEEGKACKIELCEHIKDATQFNDGNTLNIYNRASAEAIVAMIKSQPDKFILA